MSALELFGGDTARSLAFEPTFVEATDTDGAADGVGPVTPAGEAARFSIAGLDLFGL